ncbi:MAG: O-antigen ligase family protein [Planctomycetes bacterium]|nr:O-antigen ligase family protein [Planctomycetota bacterium]
MPTALRSVSPENNALHARLTVAVDLGIASTVLVAPLFMGGRGPVGRFVLVLCVAITAMLWCARQCVSTRAMWRKSGVEWLLLAGLGVLVLQLVPLPQTLLTLFSPHLAELLPLWTTSADNAVQLGTWNQVSLNPMATQSGLTTYIAYVMLFLVTFQRLNELKDVKPLLRLIAVATCLMAVLALAQLLFGNGKFLWVFEHVSRDTTEVTKGPFQNQNHLAHLLALGIGPLLWWLATLQTGGDNRRPSSSRRFLQDPSIQSKILWIAIGTVTFTALLTFSRGGVISTLLSVTTAVALLSWKRMFTRRAFSVIFVIACLMVVSLSIHGYDRLARKLGTLRDSQSIDELSHGRWALWNAHFQAIPDFWVLGSGVGTHRDIYPTYLAEHFDVEFTHGESGYLQIMLETGLLGTVLFLAGLLIAFRWAIVPLLRSNDRKEVGCTIAIIPGLIASVVHSLGDFVWYIPACMTTTVLLLAAACYLFHSSVAPRHASNPQGSNEDSHSIIVPRLAWLGTSVVCLVMFTLITYTQFGAAKAAPSWYKYRRLTRVTNEASWEAPKYNDLATLASHVEAAVLANPNDARMRVQLAGLYLQQFDLAQRDSQNPMPLSQIRDAALASRFASKQQLDDWLDRAVGENRALFDSALEHALQSVRLCPLQGEAYALLARVAFLEGPNPERKRSYIQQALQVRPFHSRVQFVAGQESLLAGNVEGAFAHWKRAFHGDAEVQNELIRELTAVIPANDLLNALAPNQRGLEALFGHYQRMSDVDSAKIVATYYTHFLAEQFHSEAEQDQLRTLRKLSALHEYLDAPDEAIRLAREASRLAPIDFELKLRLGRLFVKAGQFAEAEAELQWCVRRQPDHAETLTLLLIAKRGAILRQANASKSSASRTPFRQ